MATDGGFWVAAGARYKNDATGAPAYPPKTLLQVVLFAYSRGIVSSRAIARACEEHVTFIALCGDTRPHFTTIAHFVSSLGADIAPIFAAVLAVCDQPRPHRARYVRARRREAAQ